jgi:hypothetical protein
MGELKHGSWGAVPSTQARNSAKWVGTLEIWYGIIYEYIYNPCSHIKVQKGNIINILVLRELVTVLVENTDARISSYFGSCCAYMVFIYFFSGEEIGM